MTSLVSTLVVAALLPPPEPTALAPAEPATHERTEPGDVERERERERLLLDGTVVLGVLTTLGTAAMVTGLVFIGTAGTDPPHCGGIESPPCDAQMRRFVGRWTLIPGAVVTVPSAIGLGFVAHRLREHRAAQRRVQARVGLGSLTLRF